ncbi:MAG: hypothetical protein IJG60_05710 [Thermoguttaceae bacterium]|nr:hypothetical protein [Thermoguttaceae bacterium]
MPEILTVVASAISSFSSVMTPDPIQTISDVQEAISSLIREEPAEDALLPCSVDLQAPASTVPSITTFEVLDLLNLPEMGAPKKRGRKPIRKEFTEIRLHRDRATDACWNEEGEGRRRRQVDPTTCERDYSEDEVEFMRALDLYKKMNGRLFPTCSETLEVLRRLGYVKMPPCRDFDWNEPFYAVEEPCFGVTEFQETAAPVWNEDEILSADA